MSNPKVQDRPEWLRLLAGGFAFMTAPFAVHPNDRDRARQSVQLAKAAGISKQEYLAAASEYLNGAMGWPTNKSEQLARVEKFVGSKLPGVMP